MSFRYDVERYGLFPTIKAEIREFFWQVDHVIKFVPILWQDKDFDKNYLLRLMHFKLDLMSKHMAECSMGAKVSPTKRASLRKMRIIMSHIDHYLEIDKYIHYPDFGVKDEFSTVIPHNPKKDKVFFQCERMLNAENWHWEQAWAKISKFGGSFWC